MIKLSIQNSFLTCIFLFALFAIGASPCFATKLPKGTIEEVNANVTKVSKRLDGVLKTVSGELYVPLVPQDKPTSNQALKLTDKIPKTNPTLLIFNNGWAFLKLQKKEDKLVLELPNGLSSAQKLQMKSKKLPADLIVPQEMMVSNSLKSIVGELDIDIIATASSPSADTQTKSAESDSSENNQVTTKELTGKIFVTSPSTGKVIILKTTFEKASELQTDGTPSGMAYSNGKLFICDQTKNRILVLDPEKESFSGQIDLKAGSCPNGIVGLPDGKFLYVCATAQNLVTAIDLKTEKEVIRTRVRPGPTKIAITPNGYMLLVINGQSGEITFVSTLNQKAVGYAKIGELPSQIIITNNSKAAFVSNRVSNTISIIDITHRRVANTIKVGEGPTGIALSPDETMLFVANAKDNTIIAYSTKDYSKVKDVQLPLDVEFPGKIMFLPGTSKLLVTSAATDTLGILDIDSMEFVKQPRIGCTSDNAIWVPN